MDRSNGEKSFAGQSEADATNVGYMVGRIIGCKWAYGMLELIRGGVLRPGAMRRELPGLTPKVQTECLHIMTDFGILQRTAFASKIPHVEYTFTDKGAEFGAILDAIRTLQNRWRHDAAPGDALL